MFPLLIKCKLRKNDQDKPNQDKQKLTTHIYLSQSRVTNSVLLVVWGDAEQFFCLSLFSDF